MSRVRAGVRNPLTKSGMLFGLKRRSGPQTYITAGVEAALSIQTDTPALADKSNLLVVGSELLLYAPKNLWNTEPPMQLCWLDDDGRQLRPVESVKPHLIGVVDTKSGVLAVAGDGAVYQVGPDSVSRLCAGPADFRVRMGAALAYLPDDDAILLTGGLTTDSAEL